MESEGLRGLTDMHRLKRSHLAYKLIKELLLMWGQNIFFRAALTSLLGPNQSMEGIVVPGSKSTKYKKERDLIGLSGDQV